MAKFVVVHEVEEFSNEVYAKRVTVQELIDILSEHDTDKIVAINVINKD